MEPSVPAFYPQLQIQQNLQMRALQRVSSMLGLSLQTPMDEIELIQKGASPSDMDILKALGMPASEQHWIIKPRTLAHRKSHQEPLTQDETGRWLRAAKILALAVEVFGDHEKALRWLNKPRAAYGNRSAMAILPNESASSLIEETLHQIDSGYFA